jgi:NAD(P)-dependent dehydrogenase (short-subunit alcohol dehydrogenase family)
MTSTSSLAGKRVLVTGGSRGIGAGIGRQRASHEATVAVNYRSDQTGAVVSELGGLDLLVRSPRDSHDHSKPASIGEASDANVAAVSVAAG